MNARTHRTPIGLDVDGRSISAAQFVGQSGAWRLENAAVLPRLQRDGPLNDGEVRRLAGLLERQGFHGRSVVLGVPDRSLLSGMLELPAATAATAMQQIARLELARMHKCEPESIECGCWPLPATARAGDTTLVMAASCGCDDACRTLDLWEGQGLEVQALDVLHLARARACMPLIDDPSAVTALLDIRWDLTAMSVVHRSTVVYERSLSELGLRAVHRRITAQLGLDDEIGEFILVGAGADDEGVESIAATDTFVETRRQIATLIEAIVREIRASCAYVPSRFADTTPGELLVFGLGANIPGIDVILSAASDMQTRVVSPALFEAGSADPLEAAANPMLTTASGLARFGT